MSHHWGPQSWPNCTHTFRVSRTCFSPPTPCIVTESNYIFELSLSQWPNPGCHSRYHSNAGQPLHPHWPSTRESSRTPSCGAQESLCTMACAVTTNTYYRAHLWWGHLFWFDVLLTTARRPKHMRMLCAGKALWWVTP